MNQRLPSLNALRAFEAVVRLGGISPAARELHVTHGAISHQMRHLEEDLGLTLFRREGRRRLPTSAALQLAKVVGTAFSGIGETLARLQREAVQAPVVLGCSASVLARWIIPRLAQLQADLPDVHLHLSPQETTPDPQLTGLDAALLLSAPPWPETWTVCELAAERIGPVLAANTPLARQLHGRDPDALLTQPLLHTTSRPQAWPQWAQGHGLDPATLQLGTGFEHLYYLLEAANAGLGIAIAPEPLVRADIEAGHLLAPWGFTPTAARWALCTRADRDAAWLEPLTAWLSDSLEETGKSPVDFRASGQRVPI